MDTALFRSAKWGVVRGTALPKKSKSHPRQWVAGSDPFYSKEPIRDFEIPPTAVGGLFRSFLPLSYDSINTLEICDFRSSRE